MKNYSRMAALLPFSMARVAEKAIFKQVGGVGTRRGYRRRRRCREGSKRVRSGGMKVVGVGGCVRRFQIVRPIVAYAARARTGSKRGCAMCRVAK